MSRMRAMITQTHPPGCLRQVVASATIPNPDDLAVWLSDCTGQQAKVLAFGDEDRSVPLQKHVYSVPLDSPNPFVFDRSLNSRLPAIIREHSSGKPTLIVVAEMGGHLTDF